MNEIIKAQQQTQFSTIHDGKIAIIRLNRPEKLNAFTPTMAAEIKAAVDYCDKNDNIRVIILTGDERNKSFCAGADLSNKEKTFNYSTDDPNKDRDQGGVLSLFLFNCRKPIIAAINGSAVGVGITMTLACDYRLALETAKIGFVFTRRGIMPEGCSSYFLPRIVGISKALELTISGRVFLAKDEPSLFNYVLKTPEELMTRTIELATEIADHTAPLSVAITRKALWFGLDSKTPNQPHFLETEGVKYLGKHKDAAEGVVSFVEKRKPGFVGSINKELPDFYYSKL